jgi:hypothetical protein
MWRNGEKKTVDGEPPADFQGSNQMMAELMSEGR